MRLSGGFFVGSTAYGVEPCDVEELSPEDSSFVCALNPPDPMIRRVFFIMPKGGELALWTTAVMYAI